MTPLQHWALRILALIVIGLCCIKCSPKEAVVINVPARPAAIGSSHRLTVVEEEALRHPAPIAPNPELDAYLQGWQWWNR